MRFAGFAALVAGALAGAACGSSSHAAPPGDDDDEVEIQKGELARLRADAAKVRELEARVVAAERAEAEARAQLRVARQRLGLEAFAPDTLVATDFTTKLPEATRLAVKGGRGAKQSLAKLLADHPGGLVVAYWATWCQPCTSPEELVRLGRLRDELARVGAELVFLSVDDALADVTSDPRAERWLYPLWQGKDVHLAMLPEVYVRSAGIDLPLMLVVSKGGRVRWTRKGALDEDAVRDLVTAVMRDRYGSTSTQ